MIHSTAIIGENVKLESGVEIGPYSFIGGNVRIGKNTKIHASVSITGNTTIGENNVIFSFCSIGSIPQDLKYTQDHEWVRIEGDEATVGITDFAQGELGDIVYIEVETVGESLDKEAVFGCLLYTSPSPRDQRGSRMPSSA